MIRFFIRIYWAIVDFILSNLGGCKIKWADKEEVKK